LRTLVTSILSVIILGALTGCEQDKGPQTTRMQISDIQQVTQEITEKLATSDFMRDRSSSSPSIVITCRKAENLSMDIVQEPELWMFVLKVETSINQTNLARSKNIVFQIPPERIEMLRKKFPDAASGAEPPTHVMTVQIRSANRVTENKQGYVNGQTRLYYFDYNITRLADAKVEWNGSAEFTRTAAGLLIE